jgi:putative transposase
MRKRHHNFSYPIHITGRCINKMPYPIELSDVWKIYEYYLIEINRHFAIEINAFVLMPNHFHLIASAPKGNLSEAMCFFMRETSKNISRRAGRINQLYGRPYFSSSLQTINYFYIAYKYVYRNPVKAGLSKKAQEYIYSTLNNSNSCIPINDPLLGNDKKLELYSWINNAFSPEIENEIKKNIRKQIFMPAKDSLLSNLELEKVPLLGFYPNSETVPVTLIIS